MFFYLYCTIISAIMSSNLNTPPLKKSVVGKLSAKTSKTKNVSPCDGTLVVESRRLFRSPSASKFPRLSTNYLLLSSPSPMSALSKLSSLLSINVKDHKKKLHHELTTSPSSMSTSSKSSSPSSTKSIKKRCLVDDTEKLAAYEIDWFDSDAINNECLKYVIDQDVPGSHEEKLRYLLSQFKTSDIKLAFAESIGKVGQPINSHEPYESK